MPFILQWAMQTWGTVLEAAPWLVFGFLLAGAISVLLPTDKIVAHLGRPGLGGVVKASLVGVPLPLCSCSVIPVAAAIRRRGASRGATASFLVSTPETGVDSIFISYAMLGPFFAIIRPVAALVTALVAGVMIDWLGTEAADQPGSRPQGAAQTCPTCCHEAAAPQPASLAQRLLKAVRYGLIDMFADLSHWLMLGFCLAGLAAALLPPGFLERHVGTGFGAMLLMAAVGLPVYVCATSSTPLAAALIAKGLSPGAALVFMLTGPATNLATMLVVARDLGRRSLVLYLLSIAAVALGFGMLTNLLIGPSLSVELAGHAHTHHGATGIRWAAGIHWAAAMVLVGLMLNGLRNRLRRGRTRSPLSAAGAAGPGLSPESPTSLHAIRVH